MPNSKLKLSKHYNFIRSTTIDIRHCEPSPKFLNFQIGLGVKQSFINEQNRDQ